MEIAGLSLGPLGTNCYIVSEGNRALIFDPGGDANHLIKYLKDNNLTPEAILLTHAHFDHIGALDEIRKEFNIEVYLHENEFDWLANPKLNRSTSMGEPFLVKTDDPEKVIKPGNMEVGPFKFEVFHTPGHSPGSVSFIFHEHNFIVSGDVLFHQGIGRTDLPGGNMDELAHSIINKLYKLPDSFEVFPGHGIQTTIGSEKQHNPFTNMFR